MRRLFRSHRPLGFSLAQVAHGRTWACTDLGAFARPLPDLTGLDGIVIMEDRAPEFFLAFDGYDPAAQTRLNRHGPLHAWSTQEDLRALVEGVHARNVKAVIGFWNYGGGVFHRARWLRSHRELAHVRWSSQLYPFVQLRREGISYAEYIGRQYERLHAAFGFDGLMLGDGFCGFGSIWDPDLYRDQAHSIPRWTRFYEVIADSVHRSAGVLLAYDQMGVSYAEARQHGVDYRDLAGAGLDILVYQSYPQAWGGFWLENYSRQFDLTANTANLTAVISGLAGTRTRVLYTVELGDSVERWPVAPERTREQMETLDPRAGGRFLVWANDVLAQARG